MARVFLPLRKSEMIGRVRRLVPLVLLLALGIGCGSSSACPHGAEFVLRAAPQPGERVTPLAMKTARAIISKRLTALDIRPSSVASRGDEVLISFSGANYPNALNRIVRVRAQLQVFDFEKDLAAPTVKSGYPTPYTTLYDLLSTVRAEAAIGKPQAYYLFDSTKKHAILQGPDPTKAELLASSGGKRPAGSTILAVPSNREVVKGPGVLGATPGTRTVGRPGDGPWYLFKLPPALSSEDFKESAISSDATSPGRSEVKLGFTPHGAKEFEAITKAEYDRGRLVAGRHGYADKFKLRYAQHAAIVVDDYLYSVPYLDYMNPSLSHGIRNGSAVITNLFAPDARDLATALRTGTLPYLFNWVSPYGFAVCRR